MPRRAKKPPPPKRLPLALPQPSTVEDVAGVLSGAQQRGDPQLSELAYHFFQLNGGAAGMAQILNDLYHSADKVPMAKVRIMEIILYSVKFVNQTRGQSDLSTLSDADVERELQSMLGRLGSELGNGKTEAVAPAPEAPQEIMPPALDLPAAPENEP